MIDITEARTYAIEARLIAGADSPTGKRLSTLIEQMKNGISTAQTLAELDQIQKDGGQYIHANHGASANIELHHPLISRGSITVDRDTGEVLGTGAHSKGAM